MRYTCKLMVLLFTILFCNGCNHDTDTFDGPSLIDRFGPFEVVTELGVSQPTVDFATGETVFFTAEFNKNVNWIVEITGMESGAVKRLEGFSRVLNAETATWTGGVTELPLFREEACTAVLTVPEEPDFVSTATLETLSRRTFEGSVFTSFEEDLGTGNVSDGNFEFELTWGIRDDIAAEGEQYFFMEGTDDVVSNFFVGLMDISAKVSGAETYMELPTTVPEDLYFNCFMYSPGTPHGIAILDFGFDSNDNGQFDGETDAKFRVETDYNLATWEGWRLISHPMSETGMTQEQLEKLVGIRLLLISDMNAQPDPPIQVGFGIDYMIFTAGGPLDL